MKIRKGGSSTMSTEARIISEQIVKRLESHLNLIASVALLFQDCSENGIEFAVKVTSPFSNLNIVEPISGCEIFQGRCTESEIKTSCTLFNFKLSEFWKFYYDLEPIFRFLTQNFGKVTKFNPTDPFFVYTIDDKSITPSRFSLLYEPQKRTDTDTHMLTLFAAPMKEPRKSEMLTTIIKNLRTYIAVTNYIEFLISPSGTCKLTVHLNCGERAPTFFEDDNIKYSYCNYHNSYAMIFHLRNRRTLFTIFNYLLNEKKFKLSTEITDIGNLKFTMQQTHYYDD